MTPSGETRWAFDPTGLFAGLTTNGHGIALAALHAQLSRLVVAAATLMAGGVLAIVVMHMLAGVRHKSGAHTSEHPS